LRIPKPTAVLFDLFHTLVCVPSPLSYGGPLVSEVLGVPSAEWRRHFYDEDTHGRCLGKVTDAVDAMRLVAHSIDPTVPEERIEAAVAYRRQYFARALLDVESEILHALDRLRAAQIRIGLVSDAAADDLESWPQSPLCERFDATVFSYQVGIRKPDAGIYHEALRRLAVYPPDTVFVGDGGSDEHRGARSLGIKTVLVTRLMAEMAPEALEARRAYADWEFSDVPAFVTAIGL